MGTLTSQALLKNWNTKRFARVYLFAEQNTFEKDRVIASLKQILFPDGPDPFNHETISFPGSTVQDALNSALMLPFSGGKRFVHVKNAQSLNTAQKKIFSEGLADLPETTLMICETTDIKKNTARSPLGKIIAKLGDVVYFWQPKIHDLPRIIYQRVAEAGKTITPEAARFIAEDTGENQAQLMIEIEKVLLYCADRSVIGLKEAAQVCGQTAVYNLFNLRDNLQAKNTKKSMEILEYLLHEHMEPIKIINSLYQAYRRLFLAKLMMHEKNYSREDIIPALGINVYFDKHFFSDLNQYTLDELEQSLELLREADYEIKTGAVDRKGKLSVLVLKLTGFKECLKLQR